MLLFPDVHSSCLLGSQAKTVNTGSSGGVKAMGLLHHYAAACNTNVRNAAVASFPFQLLLRHSSQHYKHWQL